MFTFDVLRSVVFFYIKTPLRVKEAGLEELILTTWWPTHFDKEVRVSDTVSAEATHYLGIPSCVGFISSIIHSFNQFNNSGSCGWCYFVNFEAVVAADTSKHFLSNFALDQRFLF